jgi:competence protein ComEC
MRTVFLLVVLLVSSSIVLAADSVVPSADVTTRVIVRATASSASAQVGSLSPGQQAELLGSVPNWHKVLLPNGRTGFVPKRWTDVRTLGTPPPPAASPTFIIDAVDVGTGLAVLVRGPDFTLLYDAGSNDDKAHGANNRVLAYLKLVVPTLQAIDHIILSHPHTDHAELMGDLFAAYQVRSVWDSGRLHDICGYRYFLTAIRDEPGVQYHNALQDGGTRDYAFAAKRCDTPLPAETVRVALASRMTTDAPIPLGQQATMTILYADGAKHPSPNENSVVVRLNLGTTKVLFTGDAEAGGRKPPADAPLPTSIEGTLLACCASDLAADILIVGHHGSKTSSRKAFLDAVSAKIFVVSSGPTKYSSVTLPDEEIITELGARGQVFRTDVDDQACATNPRKVGADNDGKPGGCDNIRITISATGLGPTVFRGSEP